MMSAVPWDSLSQVDGFDLWEVCYFMSSSYEPEYPEIVDKSLCETTSNWSSYICIDGVPHKGEICALWDDLAENGVAVEDYAMMSKDELCGYTGEDNVTVESVTDIICDAWSDVCVNDIPSIETMCHALDSQPDDLTDLDLDWFCCDVSNDCVAEPPVFYMEIVDGYDLCMNLTAIDAASATSTTSSSDGTTSTSSSSATTYAQWICDSSTLLPYKGELCAFRDDDTLGPILNDFVFAFDALCGWTDEDGTTYESETQPVCDAWTDACTNNIPSLSFICEAPWDAPEDVHSIFEADGGSLYEFCDQARDYEDFSVEDFCAEDSDFSDVCVNGYPDFVKVCDTDFPPGTFDGSNYYQVCELDYEDVCESYPEICDETTGSMTSDLCGANPDWCDTSSESYNACAANLYDCMMDPEFDMCHEFPDLCGYEEMDDFDIPTFKRANEGANTYYTSGDYTTYTCKAQTFAMWGEVSTLIDSLNYFYDAGIAPGAFFEHYIDMGARQMVDPQDTSTITNLGESSTYGSLYVPDLAIFADYSDAEEEFSDIFENATTEEDYIDIMGDSWGYGEYSETDDAGNEEWKQAYSHVSFGYKIPASEDEPTYIGIMFEAEGEQAKMVDGAKLINWAKYTLWDSKGEETDESYAVACIITIGDTSATEVHFYDKMLDVNSMDDEELESHRISDSPWELVKDGESNIDASYYSASGDESTGYVRQPCLVIQEWEMPEIDEESTEGPSTAAGGSFGWYFVESGIRYVDEVSDPDDPTLFDFESQFWNVEYRAPEAAPELDVQVQGQAEATSTITVDQDDGTTINGTVQQSMYVGYEIVNDIDSDNIMGFYLTLDVPSDLVPEDTVIVQQVTYRKQYNFGDWHTVACKTVVGDASAAEVLNYIGSEAPDGYDDSGASTTYD